MDERECAPDETRDWPFDVSRKSEIRYFSAAAARGKRSIPVYLVVSLAFIFCGTMMKSDLVWELQDLLNQLMVLPNVAALIALSGAVAAAARGK